MLVIVFTWASLFQKYTLASKVKQLLECPVVGASVEVQGWIRTKRASKQVVFLSINDGSCLQNLQVVMAVSQLSSDVLIQLITGASVAITGHLVASPGQSQSVELQGSQLVVLGSAVNYPLQPKHHSLEFLRTWMHLRFRTTTFSAVFSD